MSDFRGDRYQSAQPCSIVDYSGAVGSIFYGVNDGITALYTCPSFSGLGITNKTIRSPRQIQTSLSLTF